MKTLLYQIELAWDEDILPEFISDYISGGCGTLNDIREAIKTSQYVQDKDIDNAVKYLEMKDMLPNKVDPYKQFVEVYNAGVDYSDFELKNMLAAVYFPHMGNHVWDNAYERILRNFEHLKDQRSERYNKYKEEKTEEVKAIMNEALDLDIMTVQDMLSNEIDNVSDEGIDADIRLYEFVARKLGVKDYDKLFVAVDDGNYNPEWIFEDGLMIPYEDHKLFLYPSAKMLAEMHPNGNIFMYFVTEDDAKKYFDLAAKFLDDFDVDENQFYDDKHAQEWMERHPNGYYNDESDYGTDVNESVSRGHKRWTNKPIEEKCTLETLEETLNRRDIKSNNKYDLLNLYLREHISLDKRKQLVEEINEGATDVELHQMLYITESDDLEPTVSETIELTDIEEQLPELTAKNGSAIVTDKDTLDKAVDWLISKGIDYDTDAFEDEYRLTWYVGVDANDTGVDVNVQVALDMRRALLQVDDKLQDIIHSSVPVRDVIFHDAYIRETLAQLLKDCDKFEY